MVLFYHKCGRMAQHRIWLRDVFFSETLKGERRALRRQAAAFREGPEQIFYVFSEHFSGGDGKADGAKVPGVGILPKSCPGNE